MDEAQAVFCAYRAAHEAAPWTPEPYDVAQTPRGYGVVVEYVHGDKVLPYIVLGILTPEEVGQGLSGLLHELHTATTSAGKDWNGAFRTWARMLCPMLSRDTGVRLVRLVDAVPDSRTLLHGDPHPSNIVFDGERLRFIDMEDVGFGHPAADLANARSRLLFNYEGSPIALRVWKSILASYFAAPILTRSKTSIADLPSSRRSSASATCTRRSRLLATTSGAHD